MTHPITYRQVLDCFDRHQLPYGVLELQHGARLVISVRGARLLGPFLSEDSPSLNWVHHAFATPSDFAALVESGSANFGGERWWIAPEVQYNIRERARFEQTYALQPAMDPGQYRLEQTGPAEWRLSQTARMQAFNLSAGIKDLDMQITLRSAADPLRRSAHYARLLDGVTYAGYEESMTFSEHQHDAIMSSAWNLIQLNPGGMILIPCSPHIEWQDYYEPVGDGQQIHPNHVRVQITGQRRYKMGYRAAYTFGRMGYFAPLDDQRAALLVRCFFNNPSTDYIDEPGPRIGSHGDSIQVYNDGGSLGGFGEMECFGQAIGGPTNRSASQDQFMLWAYVGPTMQIKQITQHLLGITL
jgi:hypothetical protein